MTDKAAFRPHGIYRQYTVNISIATAVYHYYLVLYDSQHFLHRLLCRTFCACACTHWLLTQCNVCFKSTAAHKKAKRLEKRAEKTLHDPDLLNLCSGYMLLFCTTYFYLYSTCLFCSFPACKYFCCLTTSVFWKEVEEEEKLCRVYHIQIRLQTADHVMVLCVCRGFLCLCTFPSLVTLTYTVFDKARTLSLLCFGTDTSQTLVQHTPTFPHPYFPTESNLLATTVILYVNTGLDYKISAGHFASCNKQLKAI